MKHYIIVCECDPYHSSRISHANHTILSYNGATPVKWTEDAWEYQSKEEALEALKGFRDDIYYYSIEEIDDITTLEQLAAYINENEDYNTREVERICERNGWELSNNDWDVCYYGNEKVTFRDNGQVEVVSNE